MTIWETSNIILQDAITANPSQTITLADGVPAIFGGGGAGGSLHNSGNIINQNGMNAGIFHIHNAGHITLDPTALLPTITLTGGVLTITSGVEYIAALNMNGGDINLNDAHLCIGINSLPSEENALVIEFAGESRGKITYAKNSPDELRNILANRQHIKDCKTIVIPAACITFPIILECLGFIKATTDIQKIHLHNVFVDAPTESASEIADDLVLRAETCAKSLAISFSNPEEHQKIQKLREEFPNKKQFLVDTLRAMPMDLCELIFQYSALGVPKGKNQPKTEKKKQKKDKKPVKFS